MQPVIARFLITKKVASTRMLEVLKDSIQDTGVPALKTATTQRQVYIRTMLDGGTVFDTTDGNAKGEIEVMTNEILELLA